MAVRFSPKILGLNVGMFRLFSGSPGLCLEIGFDPGTMFGAYFGQILEVKNGLNRDWFRGMLRLDDALLN